MRTYRVHVVYKNQIVVYHKAPSKRCYLLINFDKETLLIKFKTVEVERRWERTISNFNNFAPRRGGHLHSLFPTRQLLIYRCKALIKRREVGCEGGGSEVSTPTITTTVVGIRAKVNEWW